MGSEMCIRDRDGSIGETVETLVICQADRFKVVRFASLSASVRLAMTVIVELEPALRKITDRCFLLRRSIACEKNTGLHIWSGTNFAVNRPAKTVSAARSRGIEGLWNSSSLPACSRRPRCGSTRDEWKALVTLSLLLLRPENLSLLLAMVSARASMALVDSDKVKLRGLL